MYAIGIDLGTTGCKAVMADRNGNIVGQEYIEYPLIVISDKMIEQDANLWWELSCRAVKSVVERSGIAPEQVTGISVSSQGISFVLVDENTMPLSNAISWLDTRPQREMQLISDRFSETEIFKITGKRINSLYVLPKLLWYKRNKKTLYRKAYKLLTAHDFLIAKMSGRYVTDYTMAAGTMLFDVKQCCWSDKIIKAFDVRRELLPEVHIAGTELGELLPAAAEKMGLTAKTQVVVGGQDQKVAAYTAEPDSGMATLCLGTAGAMEFIIDQPVFDKKMRMPLFPYLTENKWTLEAVVSTTGAALKWYRNVFFPGNTYKELDHLAINSVPGSKDVYFYPHFGSATSPHWVENAKGMFYGLTLDSKKEDVTRSILEGIAFQIRFNIEICEKLSNKIDTITIFGSGSLSDIWCDIIAGVTGKTIIPLSTPDAVGLGAAKLAFKATGSLDKNYCKNIMNNGRMFSADKDTLKKYHNVYQKYRAVEKKLLTL